MQRFLRPTLFATALAVAVTARVFAADPGYVDFGKFLPPSNGGDFVEVNIKENLLAFAATIAQHHEPDAAALLRDLKSVRVNVVGLNDDNRVDLAARVTKVRTELEAQGWEKIVVAKQKNEDVNVFVKTGSGAAIEGVVVTVLSDNKEAVFVNIVGKLDPEKIAQLGQKLGIDPLKKIHPQHRDTAPEKPAAS